MGLSEQPSSDPDTFSLRRSTLPTLKTSVVQPKDGPT